MENSKEQKLGGFLKQCREDEKLTLRDVENETDISNAYLSQAIGARINFTEALATALPYPDEHFDAIVSSLFFHHLTPESKRKTLLEVRRVLKTGGTLHIADWGKPANLLMKFASTPVEWLDGATAKDSYAGKLPELMAGAGFADIIETADYSTVFGTLRLHRASKKRGE